MTALFNDLPTQRKSPSHLPGAVLSDGFESLEEMARHFECYETDPWAPAALLTVELMTPLVVDPCCGTGIMTVAARKAGYSVFANDLVDWGFPRDGALNFLCASNNNFPIRGNTVFKNPPFSYACDFVDKAKELGARKIICFQRYAWYESDERRRWWEADEPARIWLCGDRAVCWRFDIPPEDRKNGAPTPHAFFVWERGHKGPPITRKIWKDMVA